jgi:membrane protein YqaA with SNARE-associated domain
MQWMQRTYDKVLLLADSRHAVRYLCAVSFTEAIVFPIPPDVMLIPMGLARPERIWRLALLCTLCSVAGAVLGYALGYFGGQPLHRWLLQSSWSGGYEQAVSLYRDWDLWIIIAVGFLPIPYKIFAVTAGLAALNLPVFIVASLIGRGGRFYLLMALLALGGPQLAANLRPWLGRITLFLLLLLGLLLLWFAVVH